jgi:predicted DNA-binding transcriptional regulator YafY
MPDYVGTRQVKSPMPKKPAKRSQSRSRKPFPVSSHSDRDRRSKQAGRWARLLRVLQLIQDRGRWDVEAIRQELGCSKRTVHRDLDVLEIAGVPWFFDRAAKSFRVRSFYAFPVVSLTDDELLGLATATAATKAAGLDVTKGAKPTTDKVVTSADSRSYEILKEAQHFTEVLDLKLADHSQHRAFIRTVQGALIEKKQLSGQYESPYDGKPVKVTLHPYRLALIKSAWYLIGKTRGDDQPRTYRIIRFKSLRMTDDNAVIPRMFDLREYLGNAWAVFRGAETHDIELLFTKDAASVTETVWHHTQKTHRNSDGTVTMTFRVDGLEEIVRWIVGWAGRVKVIGPEALRKMVVDQHKKAIAING